MRNDFENLIGRAQACVAVAEFGAICRGTALEYRRTAARIEAERLVTGTVWPGLSVEGGSRNTNSLRRAAWCRRTHYEVARALQDLRTGAAGLADIEARLLAWVPEAERTPPNPKGDVDRLQRGRTAKPPPRVQSKGLMLRRLPGDWMSSIWHEAAEDHHRHLDALAVLFVTGARPAEVAWGTGVRRVDGGIEVVVVGAKSGDDAGQRWRTLTVADDVDGPAAHLARLAASAPSGIARVRPAATPKALSSAIEKLAVKVGLGDGVTAYVVRHQRCADARIVFGGDIEKVAAWLGHAGTETARCYGRLPLGGCRGAKPLRVSTSAPVRHRSHAALTAPELALAA